MKQKIVKGTLILLGGTFLAVMLVLPLATVLVYALRQGWETFSRSITDEYAVKALQLTLLTTGITVVVNTVFGIFAAWTITKFRFRGKQTLTTLIDIPFSISPVIAGLVFILVFGRIGWAYPFLEAMNLKIVFAVPGIVLATIFVTFPFVSRELIPLMQAQGNDEEEAAALMGAKGFSIFRRVTFPHIKWALLYGVILCTARSLGEFGAVSVVSGHLRGKTNTLPLHVEILFNEFQLTAAFAVSSILVLIAVIILILRNIVEHRIKREKR
ncbi:sulfate ABC transporter permease subunit CysW [Caproiciproducens sp. CPB-2]|uniref:sulfate ABC transporter permease subunit CysW n=1 Tax=unclassified Caproiciproducens TaxID=2643836 RepID=UPI0023DA16B1|nr:sulfate ABC transporter permease subunit CysW [Caproiciproducens sp. CPB-2]MDF1495668.1 sulfate ABC transporter permease subunit CysW [Caproiciproducens sp. CPB-2]